MSRPSGAGKPPRRARYATVQWETLLVVLVVVVALAAWARQAARPGVANTAKPLSAPSLAAGMPAMRVAGAADAPGIDADYLPLVTVAAMYPPAAQQQRVEGSCTVEYTIAATGAVRGVRARACTPAGVFEQSAVEAARQFKYRPRIRSGVPVEASGVRNEFVFTLQQ